MFRDQHALRHPDWSMNLYDFVSLPHTDPHDVARAIEVVCPDLTVYGRGVGQTKRVLTDEGFALTQTNLPDDHDPAKAGWVSGAVWTSTRPDGSLYVALGTYAQACTDPECNAGHGKQVQVRQGRTLSKIEQNAIKELVGEADEWPLGAGYDVEVLTGLGFLPVDAPLLGEPVPEDCVYRALDTLLLADTATWAFKVAQLHAAGFETEFRRQHPAVWAALEKQGMCTWSEVA